MVAFSRSTSLHSSPEASEGRSPVQNNACTYAKYGPWGRLRSLVTGPLPGWNVLLTLKAEWSDGTTHLLFEPIELLERLAALTPRPRINLVLHHGVLASHSRWRARAVAYGRDTLDPVGPDAAIRCGTAAPPVPRSAPSSAPWSAGRQEASCASQRDPGLMIGGGHCEPASSMPAASRDLATTVSVEEPRPRRAR